MTAAHCSTCDEYGCAGFTTPRATPEPLPPPRPTRLATDEERRAALSVIRQELADVKRKQQEAGK